MVLLAVHAAADMPLQAGAQLDADGQEWHIVAVVDRRDWSEYAVEADGKPVCGSKDGRAVRAIPLDGHWDDTMTWHADGFTLACVDGPIGKCVVWGYLPWVDGMRDLHQSCVRMVRADYCGNGVGQTKDGTPIDVWDRLGINEREKVPGMTFEADWAPDGASRIRRTRFPGAMAFVRQTCPDRLEGNGAVRDAGFLSNASYR